MNRETTVTGWMSGARSDVGITVTGVAEPPHRVGYHQLAELAGAWATSVTWEDQQHRDSVLIVATPGAAMFGAFFGLLAAGADVCLVAPPAALADRDTYRRHLRAAVAAVTPRLALCQDRHTAALAGALSGPDAPVVGPLPADGRPEPGLMRRIRLARAEGPGDLVQLTSGSTGTARCVQLAPEAVISNIAAIASWVGVTAADTVATWLPLYHDMGLIGTFLLPVVKQIDVRLMEPAEFVRDPASYLSLFGRGQATMSAMPPFGLDLLARRLRDQQLSGMDLSPWRTLIVGAERIPMAALERFAARLAGCGFQPGALCPAYGMAEATLAVTGSRPGEEPREHALPDGSGERYVSCGRPLPGVSVRVAGADDRVGAGSGEIIVASTGLARGYRGPGHGPGLTGTGRFAGGEFRSGDGGFLADGELHVIGRLGDAVKVRGTWLFAEDLQARIDHPAVREGQAVVLVGQDGDLARILVLRDRRTQLDLGDLHRYLRAQGVAAAVTDLPVSRRDILRTSSGKLRRREMWLRYSSGRREHDRT
jgi:acyl-CoA synthetase (AMP-forming)/AMP-acid ligase II